MQGAAVENLEQKKRKRGRKKERKKGKKEFEKWKVYKIHPHLLKPSIDTLDS